MPDERLGEYTKTNRPKEDGNNFIPISIADQTYCRSTFGPFKNTNAFYVVCGELVKTRDELDKLLGLCLSSSETDTDREIDELHRQQLISIDSNGNLCGTQLGRAVVASSLCPRKGLRVFNDLNVAMKSICLDTELHMLFLASLWDFSKQPYYR